MTQFLDNATEIAASIENGQQICLAPDYSGCSIAVTMALIRQRSKALHLIGVPQLGLQGDLLIGAGCVASVDAAAVTLGEFGQAPRFVASVLDGSLRMHDSTCPAIHAGLQAAEKGIPFMPLRGILGSDLLRNRDDWQVIDNPYSEGQIDPLVLVPAITPDIALFHAPVADTEGNVWVGIRRELMLMAHAAKTTLVTVERIVEENLLQDSAQAAGVVPSLYISKIAQATKGACPVGLFDCYAPNAQVLERYAQAAKTAVGFTTILEEIGHA